MMTVYLRTDRHAAMFDFIARQSRSMEVPISFELPIVEVLPDTMPEASA
jgi:hypothetical protein